MATYARRSTPSGRSRPRRRGTGLWTAEPAELAEDAPDGWAAWVARELGDVVAALGDGGAAPSGWRIPDLVALAVERDGGSLTDFARRIGVALSTASLWRDGRRQPSLDGVLRMCRATGLRVGVYDALAHAVADGMDVTRLLRALRRVVVADLRDRDRAARRDQDHTAHGCGEPPSY